jgi:hypothetical protein
MSESGELRCPLCNAEIVSGQNFDTRNIRIDCERCGGFEVTTDCLGALMDRRALDLVPFLSAATREYHEGGKRLLLTTTNWHDAATRHRNVSVSDKLEKLFQLLAKRCEVPGGQTRLMPPLDYPLISAKSWNEVYAYLGHLHDSGLIELSRLADGHVDCEVTVPGWQRLDPSREAGGEPGTCFVAMWFTEEMENIYDVAIAPAIEHDNPYKAVKINRIAHNNQITDEIMARIRGCEFMVADFTGQRGGVYYEAGFARGLGRTVIYTCRADSFKEVHFDTSVMNHLVWSDAADLRRKLADHIAATILRKA